MASAVCNSFKIEILKAIHDFTVSTGDVLKAAHFASAAALGAGTTAYSATNEVTGTGYTAGGVALTNVTPVLDGSTAIADWADAVWGPGATISGIRYTLVYNSTKANRGCFVIDWGTDQAVTNGTLTLQFPAAAAATAMLRIA